MQMLKSNQSRIGQDGVRLILVLSVLFVVAVGLRVVDLQHPSMTSDEWFDFNDSGKYHWNRGWPEPISDEFANGQLPFFVADLFYFVLGVHPWVARLVSVLFASAAVAATALLGIRMMGLLWGSAAAFLLACSPFHLSASRLAFSHGHVHHSVFVVGAMLLLWDYLNEYGETGWRRWRGAGVGLLLGLGMGTDLLSVFWCANAGVIMVLAHWKGHASFRDFVQGGVAFVVALAVASPMYLFYPLEAVTWLHAWLQRWDGYTGYLWLGQEVESIPWYYYLLVLATKISPVFWLFMAIGMVGRFIARKTLSRESLFLLLLLWPIVYLSWKSWKSPYYLTAFLPFLYLLGISLIRDALPQGRPWRYGAAMAVLLIIPGSQWIMARTVHPDYLMLGIRYSHRLYGEFQGPAVSHGQWIGEGLAYIIEDYGSGDVAVLVHEGPAQMQIRYYGNRYGIRDLYHLGDFSDPEEALKTIDYVLYSEDARRLTAPLLSLNIERNRALMEWVDTEERLVPIHVFRSGDFPLVHILRVNRE